MNKKTLFVLVSAFCALVGCSSSQNKEAEETVNQTSAYDGEINKHPYVDLGLSVFWSPMNVGAETAAECGKYFAWGEVDTAKVEFTVENATTFNKSYAREMQGNIDHDAARYLWRHTWRMPTKEEVAELIEKCVWHKDTVDNRMGYTIEGPNGKTIFLPACGQMFVELEAPDSCTQEGFYWTGSHTKGRAEKEKAFALVFGVADSATVEELPRYTGFCIRPVSNK